MQQTIQQLHESFEAMREAFTYYVQTQGPRPIRREQATKIVDLCYSSILNGGDNAAN